MIAGKIVFAKFWGQSINLGAAVYGLFIYRPGITTADQNLQLLGTRKRHIRKTRKMPCWRKQKNVLKIYTACLPKSKNLYIYFSNQFPGPVWGLQVIHFSNRLIFRVAASCYK